MTTFDQQKLKVAWLSVGSNTTLIALKLTVGLAIGSVSVISEAVHSGVDLLAALIALFAVHQASKPPDEDHPYGHGKFENISGTIEALLIFGAAAWILYEAIHKLLSPQPMGAVGWGAAVMFLSSVVNLLVSRALFRVARKTQSIALEADAWHLRTDVYTSGGVMLALGALWATQQLLPHRDIAREFGWIDPAAAILVALLILKAAYDLTRQAARDLLDVCLPEEEIQWLRTYLARLHRDFDPSIRGFHRLRTRKSGAQRFVEFHLQVQPSLTVARAHELTDGINAAIRARLPETSVLIHVEPCSGACKPLCVEGCMLPPEARMGGRS